MDRRWLVLILIVGAVLPGCRKPTYRKRTTVWMPSDEYMTITRLQRYYQRQNVDGILDTIDKRHFKKYFELRQKVIRTFRENSECKIAMEVHKHRRGTDTTTFEVHWKRTSFDVWKRKYVPKRGTTFFVVAHAKPWRIVDIYGDEFF